MKPTQLNKKLKNTTLLGAAGITLILVGAIAVLLNPRIERSRLSGTPESDLFSQGQVAMNKGDCPRAIRIFEAFLAKDPTHVPTLEFKEECHVRLKQWPLAAETARKILEFEMTPARKQRLSWLYEQAGQPEEARKWGP